MQTQKQASTQAILFKLQTSDESTKALPLDQHIGEHKIMNAIDFPWHYIIYTYLLIHDGGEYLSTP